MKKAKERRRGGWRGEGKEIWQKGKGRDEFYIKRVVGFVM